MDEQFKFEFKLFKSKYQSVPSALKYHEVKLESA